MPFSSSTSRRGFQHARAIQFDAYVRDDGLRKLDAHITDVKTCDITRVSGTRLAGTPTRRLSLRTTIDAKLNIAAEVASMFYPRWAVKPLAQSESS